MPSAGTAAPATDHAQMGHGAAGAGVGAMVGMDHGTQAGAAMPGMAGAPSAHDGMAMGAVQAALNNGYNAGDPAKFVPIVGIDATVEALQAMKDGSLLGTVLNDRTNQSIAVINVRKAAVAGTEVTEDVVGVPCKVDGKYIWIPYQIVDSTNLDAVLEVMLSVS